MVARYTTWTQEVLEDTLNIPLSELGLSVRTANRLDSVGILRIRDLLNSNKNTLMAIPNFGNKSYEEVVTILKERGFY